MQLISETQDLNHKLEQNGDKESLNNFRINFKIKQLMLLKIQLLLFLSTQEKNNIQQGNQNLLVSLAMINLDYRSYGATSMDTNCCNFPRKRKTGY